jgi:hypothetical protein
MSTHTRGDDGFSIYAGDQLIAKVNGSTKFVEVRGIDRQTADANAALIAAAPDLPKCVFQRSRPVKPR